MSGPTITSRSDHRLVIHSDAVPADDRQRRRGERAGHPGDQLSDGPGPVDGRTARIGRGRHARQIDDQRDAGRDSELQAAPIRAMCSAPSITTAHLAAGAGQGEWLMAEACEYRENFRHLAPEMAVLLPIEADHFDYYRSTGQLEGAFARFVGRLPSDGRLIYAADCPAARRVARAARCADRIVRIGKQPAPIGRPSRVRDRRPLSVCTVRHGRPAAGQNRAGRAGQAQCRQCAGGHRGGTVTWGHRGEAIAAGLAAFRGLRRRLETIADRRRLAVVDDYAHLPTEIAASLATVREMYPGPAVVVRLSAASGLAHGTSAGRIGHKSAKC